MHACIHVHAVYIYKHVRVLKEQKAQTKHTLRPLPVPKTKPQPPLRALVQHLPKPKPQTLNPKPQTLNPKPQTLWQYQTSNLEDRYAHLCNNCVQSTAPDFSRQRDESMWSLVQVIILLAVMIDDVTYVYDDVTRACGSSSSIDFG